MQQRLIISLAGRDTPGVRVRAIITALKLTTAILRDIDKNLSDSHEESVHLECVSAQKSSPLSLTIESHPRSPDIQANPVIDSFMDDYRRTERGDRPKYCSPKALGRLKELAEIGNNGQLSLLSFTVGSETIVPGAELAVKIDRLLRSGEETHFEFITLVGTLDTLELHNVTEFKIFSPAYPRGIECFFKESLYQSVYAAVRSRVSVYGKVRFEGREPKAVEVERIEPLPSNIPQFDDLNGINITDGENAADHLFKLRHGD